MIKAINPALSLRSNLEGNSDLTLAKMRRILRSHYQDRTATELYHPLSSTVQKVTEKPQEFLIRLLDLKQKVLFASQESESGLKYDPALVHGMFLHSFSIGLLSENIKSDMKSHLQKDTISDEELFEALNVCVSNETERLQKLGSRLTPKLNPVQESEAAISSMGYRVKENWTEVTPGGQGEILQDNQSHCVYCGRVGGAHVLFDRCAACKTSRYCTRHSLAI